LPVSARALQGCSVTGLRSQPAIAAARIIQPDLKAGEQIMANTATRVRIAPSPTGEPHVGTAYIALFNYLFAKKNGGDLRASHRGHRCDPFDAGV
jgi:hypothetical protein